MKKTLFQKRRRFSLITACLALALFLAVVLGSIRTALVVLTALLCWLYPLLLLIAVPGLIYLFYHYFKELF